MGGLLPFRDINVHVGKSYYAFTSPSSSPAQTLVVERPSGDLRLDGESLSGAKRVSSIAGILGIIKLGLGKMSDQSLQGLLMLSRQVYYNYYQSPTYGKIEGTYGVQSHRHRLSSLA